MSFAFLPLYTGDYLRDTQHLSCAEHGIYIKLLIHCWDQRGPAPLDERRLCGIVNARSGDEIEAMRRVLAEFFVRMDDGWYNERMMKEITRADAISGKRSEAGRAGANERMRKLREHQAIAKQVPSKCSASDATPTPTPTTTTTTRKAKTTTASDDAISAAFDRAWKAYPARAGGNSRAAAYKAYVCRIREGHTPEVMHAGVVRYATYCRNSERLGTEYVKQGSTFFGPGLHFLPETESVPAIPGERL